MKLKNIKIENFRGYKDETIIEFDDLTTFVGRNDIGKSTIVEALDIFFNDGKRGQGIVKMDKDDKNIKSSSENVAISCTFDDYPQDIMVDYSVNTSLKSEYLLNSSGLLEIKKVYRNGTLKETYIISNYPNHQKCGDLHNKPIKDLKDIAAELQINVEDNRKASLFRTNISEYAIRDGADLQTAHINIKGKSTKEIWEKISKYFPLFMLFQSDRENHDNDNVVQNPMKALMDEILKEEDISEQLENVFSEISHRSKQLSDQTIKKLKEMNADLAKELSAEFEEPSWSKAFKFRLETDDSIPANKRGSGVRRLILLNFFRAEAERRKNQRDIPNVIYAFEEPETSQHPKHQKILIEAFIEMVTAETSQVILTTHSPSITKMLPIESLRLLRTEESGEISVNLPSDDILEQIVEDLGVFTTLESPEVHSVKLAICVEGKNDISFLKTLNKFEEYRNILDVEQDDIIILPMGGSSLQFWVNEDYLHKLNLKQLHIYDSDIGSSTPNKYRRFIDMLNDRDGCIAFETRVREFENFIPDQTIRNFHPGFESEGIECWEEADISELVAQFIHSESDSENDWKDLLDNNRKKKISKAKNKLNIEYLNYTLENDCLKNESKSEIKDWLTQGAYLINNS